MLNVSKGTKEEDEKATCSICLEEMGEQEEGEEWVAGRSKKIVFFFSQKNSRLTLSCGHSFHSRCVRRWLSVSMSCPVCRQKVTEMRERLDHRNGNDDDSSRRRDDETERRDPNPCVSSRCTCLRALYAFCGVCFLPLYYLLRNYISIAWLILGLEPTMFTVVFGGILICNLCAEEYEKTGRIFLYVPLCVCLALNALILFLERKGRMRMQREDERRGTQMMVSRRHRYSSVAADLV